MAVKITLTGDVADLKSKLKDLGVEFDELDDSTVALGKSAESAGRKMEGAYGSDLEQSLARIEDATLRAAKSTETLAQHAGGMNEVAEGLGNFERVLIGTSDILGVVAEQFGVNIGPAKEYAQAAADVAGGLEGIIGGGMALAEQLGPLAAKMGPVIASTWAHVAALYAQATAFIAANAPILIIIGSLALLAAGVVLVVRHWDEIVEKFPILGKVADAVKVQLDAFRAWLTGPFVDGVQALWDKFDIVFKAIEILVMTQLKAWMIIFQTGFDVLLGIIDVFAGIFTGDMGRVKDGVLAIFGSLWEGAEKMFRLGIDALANLAPLLLEAGGKLAGALMDGMKAGLGAVAGFAGDVGKAVLEAVKSVINTQVIDRLNSALDITIPGKGPLPDIHLPSPNIPHLAKGGIIDEPTLALIGEKGPEAVVPLTSANARGGSLLGIGNEAPRSLGPSGGASAGRPTENLSLAELKSIREIADRSEKLMKDAVGELKDAASTLKLIAKALLSGSNTVGDLIGQIADGMEALPLIYKVERDQLDVMRDGLRPAFGNGL